MANPTQNQIRQLLVDMVFQSEAFIVAKGEKTTRMLELESQRAANATQSRQAQGLPATQRPPASNPDPATLPLLQRLAGVVKWLAGDDLVVAGPAQVSFKDHFAGVLTKGQLVLEPQCDIQWNAAAKGDASYQELRLLGMHRGGEAQGVDTLGKWTKSNALGALMPTGVIADNFAVLVKLLQWDPEIVGGKLEWNEMDCCITIDRIPIKDNVATGDIRVKLGECYFVPNNGRGGMRSFVPSEAHVQQAIENIAKKSPYHESREYFNNLPAWNGQSLMKESLHAIGGLQEEVGAPYEIAAIQKTNNLALLQWTKTLIGVAARTFEPGCQMDTMLLLKSKQGTKKSSLFRALAPANRFSDAHIEFGNKDSYMSMQQNTLYECAELSGMLKKEVQGIKGFISSRSDDFRFPYGKAMTKNPRHCVLVGTTNDDTFLRDATGSRRFWVIVIHDDKHKTNITKILMIKEQLWAEALHLYRSGFTCQDCQAAVDGETRCDTHRWWLSAADDEFREEVNEQFTEVEPFIPWLQDWRISAATDKKSTKQGLHVAHKNTDSLKVHELLEAAGVVGDKCHDAWMQRRMVHALKYCGYTIKRTPRGNFWVSPEMAGKPSLSVVPKEEKEKEDTENKHEEKKSKIPE